MESGEPFPIIRDASVFSAAKSNSYFHGISDRKYSDTKEKTPPKFAGHADRRSWLFRRTKRNFTGQVRRSDGHSPWLLNIIPVKHTAHSAVSLSAIFPVTINRRLNTRTLMFSKGPDYSDSFRTQNTPIFRRICSGKKFVLFIFAK